MAWFKKARKPLAAPEKASRVPEGLWEKCPECDSIIYTKDLVRNLHVCEKCGHHFRMGAVDRLKKRGVAERDIQTANLSVNPRYDYETRPGAPMLVGYAASNTLTVKLRDIDKAGAVIDETVKEGANTLGGLSFGFENADPLFDKARAAAVADARDRAELLAKAAGVELGPILQIREGVDAGGPVPVFDGRVAMAEAKSTVVAAGESTVTATVTLVYEIQ